MTVRLNDPGRRTAVRTFLIADIRGYTRFTGQHGDEAASRLARKFAEVVGEAVEAWGGELVELRGDEALAVFDSPRQALRCAIELQDAFAHETRAEPDLPLGVGIGLDIGEAVSVGDGYRGAALNIAARLCASAAADEIVASRDLTHLAGPMPGIVFTPLAATELKGVEGPVEAVRISQAHPVSGQTPVAGSDRGTRHAEPLPAELEPVVPLAGRTAEMRWLRWHWRRASHGHGRTVVLSGPPGIGKTRLSAELATIVQADRGAVRYLPSARGADDPGVYDASAADSPALIVIDDLDAAPSPLPVAVADLARGVPGTNRLLLVTHREVAAAVLAALVEQLAPAERRRVVGPLEPDAVRAIAALYAGRAIDELPLRSVFDESAGVPAAVHRVAARWARSATARRLGESVDRTESGRQGLRDAELELMSDVADRELARDRTDRLETVEAAAATAREAAPTVCPYKGLAAYEAADSDYYFGRERLVAELVARLVGNRFLGVVGPSGSGKSSALRAGLLPATAGGVLPGSETWLQVVLRPGEHPLAELQQALARAGMTGDGSGTAAERVSRVLDSLGPARQLLLVVDQFEEVFGATRDEQERGAFIDLLTTEHEGLKVIVTLRADHYGSCAAYPALARLLAASNVLVGPLTPLELEAVIEHPAQRVGLRVEPELTQELIADAGTEPGVLPLLSTSLLELWQARKAGRLTLAAYRANAGLRGAVARLAEAAYAQLDPGQAAIARAVFLRLAGPGEGEGVVRRRVPLAELDAERDPAVARVLAALTAARLLTSGDGYVEVAHEALLREWPRLQGWLEEDAAGRRLRLHLIGAVRDWEQRGREAADLYRGARLSAALDWAAEHQLELNSAEREYLGESRLASERQVERERRNNRRLRALLAGAAVLLVLAVGAGAVAVNQAGAAREQTALAQAGKQDAIDARKAAEDSAKVAKQREQQAIDAQAAADRSAALALTREQQATDARAAADKSALTARSHRLAASSIAVLAEDPSLSKLLAAAAASIETPDRDIGSALQRAWAADRIVARYPWQAAFRDEVLTDIRHDGRLMVSTGGSTSPRRHLEVNDLGTASTVWSYDAPPGASVGQAFFTLDGARVIAGVFWDPGPGQRGVEPPLDQLGVVEWDATSGRLVRRLDTGRCGAVTAAISAVSAIVEVVPDDARPTSACFSIQHLAPIEIVDLQTGARTVLVGSQSSGSRLNDAVLSGDGRIAAFDTFSNVGGFGLTAAATTVIDVATGKRLLQLDPNDPPIQQQNHFVRSLNPDGSRLLYGDGPLKVIDTATGTEVASLDLPAGVILWAFFGPDGATIYATGFDGTLRQLNADSGAVSYAVPSVGDGRPSAADDGRVLVSDPAARSTALVDPRVPGELDTIRTCNPAFTLASSLNVAGGRAAFGTICFPEGAGFVDVFDVATHKITLSAPHHDGQSNVLSPDGTRYAGQESIDGMIGPLRIYDSKTGTMERELQGMCTYDSLKDPMDPEHPLQPCEIPPKVPFGAWDKRVVWSPDGTLLALSSDESGDGLLAVWDTRDGHLVHVDYGPKGSGTWDAIFSPDGTRLINSRQDGELRAYSTTTWSVTQSVKLAAANAGGTRLGFAGFLADRTTLVGLGGFLQDTGGTLYRIDSTTFEILGTRFANKSQTKALAVSPDRTLVATAGADGLVRIWEGGTTLVDEISVTGVAQGVAFLDDRHVAIAPRDGDILIMTIDPEELGRIVRASVSRGFTPSECERFFPDTPCPTLEELRGQPAASAPSGTGAVTNERPRSQRSPRMRVRV